VPSGGTSDLFPPGNRHTGASHRVISREGTMRKLIDSDGFDIARWRKLKPRPGGDGLFPFGRSGRMAIFNVMPRPQSPQRALRPYLARRFTTHARGAFTAKARASVHPRRLSLRGHSENESGLKA